jgi:hypothetical protein
MKTYTSFCAHPKRNPINTRIYWSETLFKKMVEKNVHSSSVVLTVFEVIK